LGGRKASICALYSLIGERIRLNQQWRIASVPPLYTYAFQRALLPATHHCCMPAELQHCLLLPILLTSSHGGFWTGMSLLHTFHLSCAPLSSSTYSASHTMSLLSWATYHTAAARQRGVLPDLALRRKNLLSATRHGARLGEAHGTISGRLCMVALTVMSPHMLSYYTFSPPSQHAMRSSARACAPPRAAALACRCASTRFSPAARRQAPLPAPFRPRVGGPLRQYRHSIAPATVRC